MSACEPGAGYNVGLGTHNKVILTAKDDFVFTNGAKTLESASFKVVASK